MAGTDPGTAKLNADRGWGQLNQAVRNDVPRALVNAKRSVLNMRRRRRRG